ncbi:AraC family transcriptional regulator [Hyphococcus sp.]|uniref:AraC family transcriptional regulator n=1 Tax=Hyphococcus sp. TaxID=2038636 RepID=UPI003D0CEE7E
MARFRATSFGIVNAGAPWGVEAPDIDYAIIYSVIHGPVWFEGGGLSQMLDSGDVVFLPHGDRHRLASGRDVTLTEPLMELLRRKPGNYVFEHGGKGAPIQFIAGGSVWDDAAKATVARFLPEALVLRQDEIAPGAHIAEINKMVVKEGISPRPQSGLVVNGLFNLLLTELLSAVFSAPHIASALEDHAASGKIARALLLIHHSASFDWTSSLLAQRVGLSRSVFSKRFTQETGRSPGAYIKQLRLHRAATLLRGSHVSIADAAEHAGYASIPSFCQAFKAFFGATPHDWRRPKA